MASSATSRIVVLLCALLLASPAWAQTYVSGHFATATSTSPSVTRTATAGNFLFALVTVNGVVTCTPATGWTIAGATLDIYSQFTSCAFFKANASGSDSYTFTIGTSAVWTLGVAEYSGMGASSNLRTHAQQQQTVSTPESGATGSGTSGDLVIAILADSYEGGAITVPSGYTGLTLTGASQVHYGTNYSMMGAIAWKSSSGGTENPAWTLFDAHFASAGAYIFNPSGGVAGCTGGMLLTGAGKC